MSDESHWGNYADWVVAIGTLILGIVAVFQDRIRAWLDSPQFEVTTETAPPCCVVVPVHGDRGKFIANYVYLRLRVNNVGTAAARNVEAYAHSLDRIDEQGACGPVRAFPPMNLTWADTTGSIYIPSIPPNMGRYCNVCHVPDPAHRIEPERPRYAVPVTQTTMSFDLQFAPNHKGHVVGPGRYVLEVRIAADNCRPIGCKIALVLDGIWNPDETIMLRDHVDIQVQGVYAIEQESWWEFFFGRLPRA